MFSKGWLEHIVTCLALLTDVFHKIARAVEIVLPFNTPMPMTRPIVNILRPLMIVLSVLMNGKMWWVVDASQEQLNWWTVQSHHCHTVIDQSFSRDENGGKRIWELSSDPQGLRKMKTFPRDRRWSERLKWMKENAKQPHQGFVVDSGAVASPATNLRVSFPVIHRNCTTDRALGTREHKHISGEFFFQVPSSSCLLGNNTLLDSTT